MTQPETGSAIDTTIETVDGQIEPEYALIPWTGELLPIRDLSNEAIATILDDAREFEQVQIRGLKRDLQNEVLRRMDADVSWTLHLEDGRTLTGDGPGRTEWDVPSLRGVLDQLVKEGYLAKDVGFDERAATDAEQALQAAAGKGIRVKVTYEAAAAGLNALLKLGGDITDMIETCRLPSSRPRSVQVKS